MDTFIIMLYDIYGKLLTEKQRNYFEDYYFKNLSLSEISENYNISRNAIHKQLKVSVNKLNEYEDILNIHKKDKLLNEAIEEIEDEYIKEKLNKINDRM